MGTEDIRRQQLNVFRMNLLGAKVIPVDTGSKTLKDAINESLRRLDKKCKNNSLCSWNSVWTTSLSITC